MIRFFTDGYEALKGDRPKGKKFWRFKVTKDDGAVFWFKTERRLSYSAAQVAAEIYLIREGVDSAVVEVEAETE